MTDVIKTSPASLDRRRLCDLLDSYIGAIDHARWVRESGQPPGACEAARRAAMEARATLLNAVCP